MGDSLLRVALLLAYGPLLLMLFLYAAALVLRLAGRPELLTLLVDRTKAQEPVKRGNQQGH